MIRHKKFTLGNEYFTVYFSANGHIRLPGSGSATGRKHDIILLTFLTGINPLIVDILSHNTPYPCAFLPSVSNRRVRNYYEVQCVLSVVCSALFLKMSFSESRLP